MSTKEFSEEVLSAYLDGELKGGELSAFETNLRSVPALAEELKSLQLVREKVGSHLRESIAAQPLNLWSELESKIELLEKRQERSNIFASWRTFLSPGLHSLRFNYAAVGAFGVVMFAVGLATSKWVDLPEKREQLASKERAPVLVELFDASSSYGNGPRLGGDLNFVSNTSSTPVIGFSPQFVRPPTLSADHLARNAGYRASGVDIEWVRSPKGIKLLSSSKREVAPVLWVGAQ